MTWGTLLLSLWVHRSVTSDLHHGPSHEVVLLLKLEPNPKCFTRTEEDFTCFFETADDDNNNNENNNNDTYDLLYTYQSKPTARCPMSVRRAPEGPTLHFCVFPDSDVLLFVDLDLQVVQRHTDNLLFTRKLSVEDHVLLDAPFNVSLRPMGRVGQLEVWWNRTFHRYLQENTVHRIRYSSQNSGEKIDETDRHTLVSLVPGEEVQVQVSVKSAPDGGHWSSWSAPARAAAPQSADDVSLACSTSDLRRICCSWNQSSATAGSPYRLFYSVSPGTDTGSRTEWDECHFEGDVTEHCCFLGDQLRNIRVKLVSSSAAITRLFYSEEFTLNHSIQTSSPVGVRAVTEGHTVCVEWDAPLPSVRSHLLYELHHQTSRGRGWTRTTGPDTETCVDVPAGSHYSAKVRAKPSGSTFSGQWSDWSDPVTGDSPPEVGLWLTLCVPASLLVMASVLLCSVSSHLRKLKMYFWPPVPDLDKVLQSFLMEINRQTWDPPVTAKSFLEEPTSSVLEVMTKEEVAGLGRASVENPEVLSAGEPSVTMAPDYVCLSKESVPNRYIYEGFGEGGDPSGEQRHGGFKCRLGSDLLNQSYVPVVEPRNSITSKSSRAGNVYTNVSNADVREVTPQGQ